MILTLALRLPCAPALARRLPVDVVPEHYDIAVTPNLQSATFTGSERITVTLKKWEGSATHRTLAQVKQFFAAHKVPDAERTLQQAIERISACVTRSAGQSAKLATWLNR